MLIYLIARTSKNIIHNFQSNSLCTILCNFVKESTYQILSNFRSSTFNEDISENGIVNDGNLLSSTSV